MTLARTSAGNGLLLTVAAAMFLLFCPFVTLRFWRGKASYSFRRPSYFPLSERAWRHTMMTLPVGTVGMAFLVLGAWAFRLGVDWLGLAFAFLFAATAFVAWPLVFLWNRPRLLVPPFLRDDPGYVHDRP